MILPHDGPLTAWLEEDGIAFEYAEMPVLRRAALRPRALAGLALRTPAHLARMRSKIENSGAVLVYVNTITLPHWVLAARRAGVPVLVHVHESDERMPGPLGRGIVAPLRAADRVIAVSEAVKRFISARAGKLQERVEVVYNGIAAPDEPPTDPALAAPIRLTVIGRLNPNKGQDLAIGAAAELTARGHDVRLRVVGDVFEGYEYVERELRELVLREGLEGRVVFDGFVPEIWPVLEQTDILLAPSRTDSLPLTVIEAMLAGRPIVASAVGGIPELIEDGVSGRLVAPGQSEELVSAVEALIRSPDEARELGSRARLAAGERFAPSRFKAEMARVADAVLSAR